jgi:hypothetical protein
MRAGEEGRPEVFEDTDPGTPGAAGEVIGAGTAGDGAEEGGTGQGGTGQGGTGQGGTGQGGTGQGGTPRRRRSWHAPRWAVRGGAVAVVLALLALGGWQGNHARPTPRPVRPNPQPAPPVPTFGGPALRETTGVRLLLAAYTLSELDLDTGASTPINGIPRTPNGYKMWRLAGGAVLVRAQGSCPHCPGPFYLLPAGAHDAVSLAGWDVVAPAAEPDRLWGYHWGSGPQPDNTTARQLDLAGHPVGPSYPLRTGRLLVRGTVAGLLLAEGPYLLVIDPRDGAVRYRVGGDLLVATADKLALVDRGCVTRCSVRVLDLATGERSSYPTPGRPFRAAFGEGGLAVGVAEAGPGGEQRAQAYLLSRDRPARRLANPMSVNLSLEWSGPYLLLATTGGLITDGPPALSAALTTVDWPLARRLPLPLSGAQLLPR